MSELGWNVLFTAYSCTDTSNTFIRQIFERDKEPNSNSILSESFEKVYNVIERSLNLQ